MFFPVMGQLSDIHFRGFLRRVTAWWWGAAGVVILIFSATLFCFVRASGSTRSGSVRESIMPSPLSRDTGISSGFSFLGMKELLSPSR